MSSFLTSAGENYLLDLITQASGAYASYWVALGRNNPPSRFMLASEFDEPTSLDYARAGFANYSGNWTERLGQVSNAINIEFPVCTTAWGVIKYWAIASASEGGVLLWAGSFATPITVGVADQVVLTPGTLTLKTTGYISHVVV